MKFKKTRIGFSVCCGVLCLLLIGMWVRSYWRFERISTQPPNTALVEPVVESLLGRVWFIWPQYGIGMSWWEFSSVRPEDYFHVKSLDYVYRPKDVLGFGIGYYTQWGFCVPHWFLAGACVALAAVPWIRWSSIPWEKWSWRFSLRTLLIFTTLVALVLGLVVYFAEN